MSPFAFPGRHGKHVEVSFRKGESVVKQISRKGNEGEKDRW